ncbi:hypothetical protein BDN67DRAFT_1014828 [Paxillus ammoniavirescens]|nr:hypothetical protein BDN67DRAFT_1014828 [Paxillus ammoniavirescens]
MHYETHNPYAAQYQPQRGFAEHLPGPGAPPRGMQGDLYRQCEEGGHGDFNNRAQYMDHGWYGPHISDPQLQPYPGSFVPMGGHYYPQYRIPYPETNNPCGMSSALPPQGDPHRHMGYSNTAPAYGEVNRPGYYYRGQAGEPNSQFCPSSSHPVAYSNPPDDLTTLKETDSLAKNPSQTLDGSSQ